MKLVWICLLVACAGVYAGPAKNARIFYNDDPMKSSDLFEGDIQLDPEQIGILGNPNRGLNQVSGLFRGAWPNGVVPYILDSAAGFTTKEIEKIADAMKLIQDQTRQNGIDCIKFVPRSNEGTYLKIGSQTGCWSYVGRTNLGGAQEVSLQRPATPTSGHCIHVGTIAHELIHALGFFHEQSRADRDQYIKIVEENIIENTLSNFQKITTGYDYLDQPYDLKSIMHYEWNAFTKNGEATVISLDPSVELVNAAYKTGLTDIDVNELRAYYKCKA